MDGWEADESKLYLQVLTTEYVRTQEEKQRKVRKGLYM